MNIKIKGYLKDNKLIWKCKNHKKCKGIADKMDGLCEECKKKEKNNEKQGGKGLFDKKE